ncbi:MAG: hypothetical protein ACKOPN_07055 [Prochlorococcaceae cyanobacterium]
MLHHFHQQLPIIGTIEGLDPDANTLQVRTRSGDCITVHLRATTRFQALRNLDGVDRRRQRFLDGPPDQSWNNLALGDLVAVDGIYSHHDGTEAYDAACITELISHQNYYHFEHTFWWVDQLKIMAKRWLDNLFGDKVSCSADDYSAAYRTLINIQGQTVEQEGDLQEMATLSRLIYGFATAYHLTGEDRFLHAASAGVSYQREAFRSISADGRFCFWLHARRRDREGRIDILPSEAFDDAGSIPLYEQIFALAGLVQYYRISNDWEVLHDIQRTITSFNTFFADRAAADPGGPGRRPLDGFFSYLDPVRFSWNSPELDTAPDGAAHTGSSRRRGQKNWNATGDHLPVYLISLILALDPLPQLDPSDPDATLFQQQLDEFRALCHEFLDAVAHQLAHHFVRDDNPFVIERFQRDWQPITDAGWQQNRAVVGHNLKIVWTLSRVAHYFSARGDTARAEELGTIVRRLGCDMAKLGIDQIRSGVFDLVEREPCNGMPVQFVHGTTRDFWQQEQGILAYLSLFALEACSTVEAGAAGDTMPAAASEWLGLARELQAYWNLHFLDHDRRGVFFRISDSGHPVIGRTHDDRLYADKGGHAISGYHVFELAYLAQVYQRAFLPRRIQQHTGLTLHFAPSERSRMLSLNALPDCLPPGHLKITEVWVDGLCRFREDRDGPATGAMARGQVPLLPHDRGRKVMVTFHQSDAYHQATRPWAVADGRPF